LSRASESTLADSPQHTVRDAIVVRPDDPRWPAAASATVSAAVWASLAFGCAGSVPPARAFPDRPVAWQEHDDGNVARPPTDMGLVDLDVTIVLRDSLAGEVDYHLTREGRRPAGDVNALDEVPCSTWFCARNHLQAMSPAAAAIGPPAAAALSHTATVVANLAVGSVTALAHRRELGTLIPRRRATATAGD